MNETHLNDTIARIWGPSKCLEARNGLTTAYLTDYAMLQGCGGRDHARTSGIYVVITDSTPEAKNRNNGTGVVVGATVPTKAFAVAKDVAEFNLGTVTVDEGDITTGLNALGGISACTGAVFAGLRVAIAGLKTITQQIAAGTAKNGLSAAYAQMVGEVQNTFESNAVQRFGVRRLGIPVYKDWNYSQTRVNTYKRFPDGRVAASTLSFARQQYQNIGGQEQAQKKPWTVYITSSRVFPNPHQNGTVSIKPGSEVDKSSVFMKLDDEQMFDFCRQVCRFEEVWSVTTGWGLISEALRTKSSIVSGDSVGS